MLYEENIVKKKLKDINIRFGLIYPNVYKVAMSSLGYQILYNLFVIFKGGNKWNIILSN